MRLSAIILLLSLTLMGCGGGEKNKQNPSANPSVSKGQTSPAFNLTAVDGSTISLKPSENPDGDIHLVLFWSYRWDPNVKTLLQRYAELHERYAPRGLRIIAVAYGEEPSGLRTFLAENKTPFPVAVGVDSTFSKFDLKALPTAILVDKSGKIADRWEGHFSTEEMGEKLKSYLPGRDGNSES